MPLYIAPTRPADMVWDRAKFAELVAAEFYVDGDGYAVPVRDGLADPTWRLTPSEAVRDLPSDATGVLWVGL